MSERRLTHEEKTGRYVIFNPSYRPLEVAYAHEDKETQGRGYWVIAPFGERRFNNQFAVDTILRNNASKGAIGLLFDKDENIMIDNRNIPYVLSRIPEGLTYDVYRNTQTLYGVKRSLERLEVAKLQTQQAKAEAKAAGTSLELSNIKEEKYDKEIEELNKIIKTLGGLTKEEVVETKVDMPEWMKRKAVEAAPSTEKKPERNSAVKSMGSMI